MKSNFPVQPAMVNQRNSPILNRLRRCCSLAALAASCLATTVSSRAQWLTQSILIKPGWTAIYLHVDASHQSLDQLVGADLDNPISEIWLWLPASTAQFVT